MPTYYRALVGRGYISRWTSKHFHSSHFGAPNEWYKKWSDTKSQNPDDYPLSCSNGVYTQRAKECFIRAITDMGEGNIWSLEVREIAGELDGVCAFETPLEAFRYGRESEPGIINEDFYVEFEGEYLGKAPEDKGVVARVIDSDDIIYSNEEFRVRHDLDPIQYPRTSN